MATAAYRGLYQLEGGEVVRVVGRGPDRLELADPETGERWPTPREPFEADLDAGYIQRVRARYEPVGETEASASGR